MTNPQTGGTIPQPNITADYMKLFHDLKGPAERMYGGWRHVDRHGFVDGDKTVNLIVDNKGKCQGLAVEIAKAGSPERVYLWDTNGDGVPEFFYRGSKTLLFSDDMIDLSKMSTQNKEQLEKLVREFQDRVRQGINDVASRMGEQLSL